MSTRRGRWSSCADPRRRAKRTLGGFVVVLALLVPVPPAPAVDLGDGLVQLRHVTYAAERRAAPLLREEVALARHDTETWIVAFQGPVHLELQDAVSEAGGRIVGYVASSAYLVRGSAATAQAIDGVRGVLRVDLLRPEWRIAPEVDASELRTGNPLLFVDVFAGEDVEATAGSIRELGVEVLRADREPGLARLLVRATPAQLGPLSDLSEVEWIEPPGHVTLRNDNVRWVIQSNDTVGHALPLYDHGLFGAGQVIGHIDTGFNLSSCFFFDPDVPVPGPTHRKVVGYRDTGATFFHGLHTAGTAAGENFDLGSPSNRGMAPKARITHANSADVDGLDYNNQPSNFLSMLADSHADGARIHTNSWGDDRWTSYTDWCVDVDTFSRLEEDDLVVFAVSNGTFLHTPENAKNCLAVGATREPALQDSISSGGRGPTADGRRKPEVYAPGRNTLSASTSLSLCGVAAQSGTSMAAPAVAGGAALVREYFLRGFYPTGRPWTVDAFTPTGALVKAAVINSTVDMTREAGYPGLREGWGRILLDNALYFPGDDRRLWVRDIRHAEGLSSGEARQWTVTVRASTEPFTITMAFMDMPPSPSALIAPVNDLDLEVEGPDGLFRGNQFDTNAGVSLPGFSPDPLNNVERVILSSPTPGAWTIRVRGTSVPLGPQGFAVVVNGGLLGRELTAAIPRSGPPEPPGRVTGLRPDWRLDPVRPTPFRTQAAVNYAVPVRSPVTLRVYDVSGRLVRVLLDRTVDAGEHGVLWNGRDDAGAPVTPGIYLLRLTAPGFERTVRSVLLR